MILKVTNKVTGEVRYEASSIYMKYVWNESLEEAIKKWNTFPGPFRYELMSSEEFVEHTIPGLNV